MNIRNPHQPREYALATLIAVVRNVLAIEETETIGGETRWADLNMDSLDGIEIQLVVEQELDVAVIEDKAWRTATTGTTLNDTAEFLVNILKTQEASHG